MIFYKKYPGDYAADTKHLSILEHGVYNLLLDIIYTTEKPIPRNHLRIRTMLGAHTRAESAAIQTVLKDFFVLTRWGWTNKRFLKEKKRMDTIVSAARANGKKGGRPSKARQHKTEAKPTGLFLETEAKAIQTPDSRHQTPEPQDQAVADVFKGSAKPNGNAAAAAASHVHASLEQIQKSFESICSEPFGSREFQNFFADISARGAPSDSDAMERTIQCCKAAGVAVPGRFYKIKHALEKLDSEQLLKRTPI